MCTCTTARHTTICACPESFSPKPLLACFKTTTTCGSRPKTTLQPLSSQTPQTPNTRAHPMASATIDLRFANGSNKWSTLSMPCGPNTTLQDVKQFLLAVSSETHVTFRVADDYRMFLLDSRTDHKTLRHALDVSNMISVFCLSTSNMHFTIKAIIGTKFDLCVPDNLCTIKYVKQMIKERKGLPEYHIRLIFAGEQLRDMRTLREYDIVEGSIVHLAFRLRGGGPPMPLGPLSIVDVQNESARKLVQWSASAPKWRTVHYGFCVEGRCMRESCIAYRRRVICSQEFGTFDLERSNATCPMCKSSVTKLNIGFNNCFYKIRALKTNSMMEFCLPWREVGDQYETWDETAAGQAEFDYMEVITRPLEAGVLVGKRTGKHERVPLSVLCAICMYAIVVEEDTCKVLQCSHSFHDECWSKWEAHHAQEGAILTCPLCRAVVSVA